MILREEVGEGDWQGSLENIRDFVLDGFIPFSNPLALFFNA